MNGKELNYKKITTRTLLREFKNIKNILSSGEEEGMKIELDNDKVMYISVENKPRGNAAEIIKALENMKPIKVKRNHELFNTLFDRIDLKKQEK